MQCMGYRIYAVYGVSYLNLAYYKNSLKLANAKKSSDNSDDIFSTIKINAIIN